MINTILFDLDNTLLDFSKAERIALSKALLRMGIEPQERILKRYSEINDSQWKLFEQGFLTRDQVIVRRYELLFEEIGVCCSAQKTTELYEKFLEEGYYYIDGAQELLEKLYKDYRLYMVTNGTAPVQRARIKSSGIDKYFQDIFISEEVGLNKPGIEYFQYCFRHIPDFKKETAIIVGDSLTSDILGGRNAGITTVWFHSPEKKNTTDIIPDYEIFRLTQLEELLKNKF